MKEAFIQLIWKTGIYRQIALKTTCGKDLRILSPGTVNHHAGPDFFNARVRIGNIVWAGNVEVHLRSSDWIKHRHHLDGAYNNVILHVVLEEDSPAFNAHGRRIVTLQLPDPKPFIRLYESLQTDKSWLPCHRYIHRVSPLQIKHCLEHLYEERLEQKISQIDQLLYSCGLDGERSLCQVLASTFGLPINALPFHMTMDRIPYELLFQNRENLQSLEGILLGQAGFLTENYTRGPYAKELYLSYQACRKDLKVQPLDRHLWKFLRLRPASFPTLRITQFASLLHQRLPILESVLSSNTFAEIEQLLRVSSSSYWDTHYNFGKRSPESIKVMGSESVLRSIVNGLVPFMFSYGRIMHHKKAIILANRFLKEARAESNYIIKKWATFEIIPTGANESQALIQLYNAYCKQKRCMDCPLGSGFIRR